MRRFALGVVAATLIACGGGNEASENLTGGEDATTGDGTDGTDAGGGLNPDLGGAESLCTPRTCADAAANCGPIADGCGGFLDCGTCKAPETCGGGGKPSVCGGNSGCIPKTCTDLSAKCGPQGDGCGGLLDCGMCPAGETCGGGGTPNVCGKGAGGDGGACKPKTCAEMMLNCGPVADGCGALVNCGTCTAPAICGGGGKPNVCGGSSTCTKKTCADYGANCGPVADGCGGIIPTCGTCTAPAICGGGGTPSVCGGGTAPDGGPVCTGIACDMPSCPIGTTTSVSGTVYDPAGKVPLYNMNVYVPNTAVSPFVDGASCDKCADALSGSPIAQTVTGVDGKFKLTGIPAPKSGTIPLVIQSGKWRRQVTVPVTACRDTAIVDKNLTRLPRNKSEGNIPKIALTTGSADPLECLLKKIGIDVAEFTNPTGTGRVNLFRGATGASAYGSMSPSSGTTYQTAQTALWNSLDNFRKYDVVLMACEGSQYMTTKPTTARQAMLDYTALGGRVFMTHFHNGWLQNGIAPWPSIATVVNKPDLVTPITAKVNMTFPKGDALATWLVNVGGSTVKGDLAIRAGQHTIDATNATYATNWINATAVRDVSGATVNSVQYFTFNTPAGAAPTSQCGRVVFSDIHASSGDSVSSFPNGCTTTNLTPQELALEFMLFDLTSRVCDDKVPPPPPTCVPKTCASLGISCGPAADGCGALLNCGTCVAPDTCGGGGVAGKCGRPLCTKKTCAEMGVTCGPSGDGCGGTQDCGACPETGPCVPMTCGGRCGPQGDGCGGLLSCPPCEGGTCVPTSCTAAGAECGKIPDGCGALLDCGGCVAPATCDANKCIGIK